MVPTAAEFVAEDKARDNDAERTTPTRSCPTTAQEAQLQYEWFLRHFERQPDINCKDQDKGVKNEIHTLDKDTLHTPNQRKDKLRGIESIHGMQANERRDIMAHLNVHSGDGETIAPGA